MISFRIFAAACALAFTVASAHAVTFDVSGSNGFGQTLLGTLEADAALTNVMSVNLQVSPAGPVPSGPFALHSFVSPLLLVTPGYVSSFTHIYLSFAGGPTLSEVEQLIESAYQTNVATSLATFDPAICSGNLSCEAFVLSQQAGALAASLEIKNASFAAVATAEVPLPAALPLFATVLGGGAMAAWKRRRRAAALDCSVTA